MNTILIHFKQRTLRHSTAPTSIKCTRASQHNIAYPFKTAATNFVLHYSVVIMSPMASQITGVSIVYSTVCSGADQRKHQSSASLAFVRGIHRSPVNSPHKGPVTRKMFPFDDVIMVLVHVRSLYSHSGSKHDIPYSYSKTLSFMWKYAVALAICIDNMIRWTDCEDVWVLCDPWFRKCRAQMHLNHDNDMETISSSLTLSGGSLLVTDGYHSRMASNAELWCW